MSEFLESYIRGRKYDIAKMQKRIDTEHNPNLKAKLVKRMEEAKRLVDALQNELEEVTDE